MNVLKAGRADQGQLRGRDWGGHMNVLKAGRVD